MSDELDLPDDDGYEMVMPFVTVESKGGPHEDGAYVCGWECGVIDSRLACLALIGGATLSRTVHTANLPQLDLIAMKHGFRMERTASPAEVDAQANGEWAFVEFSVQSSLGDPG